MQVAVTGGSGFVGAVLVRRLLAQGHRVRCLVRNTTAALDGLDVELVKGDVLDPDSLAPLLDGAEVSYHLAAFISIDGDHGGRVTAINVDGARNVARAALAAGVRRHVHTSSIHAFDLQDDGTVDETSDRAGPRHPAYDRSKAAGEAAVQEVIGDGLDGVIVYPSGVFGPGDHVPSRFGQALLWMANRSLPALVPGGFTWVDVRDVVDGILAAAERGRTGEGYLLAGYWASVPELALMVGEAAQKRPMRLTVPMWLARATAPAATVIARALDSEPLYTTEGLHALRAKCRVSDDKARAELGFAPRPLAESIGDTIEYYRQQGWLR